MTDDTYNGWSNRETWALALHIDNTYEWQQMRYAWAKEAKRLAAASDILSKPEYRLGQMLKDWAEDAFERVYHTPDEATKDERMMACDVGSLWRVDYREIARNWLTE